MWQRPSIFISFKWMNKPKLVTPIIWPLKVFPIFSEAKAHLRWFKASLSAFSRSFYNLSETDSLGLTMLHMSPFVKRFFWLSILMSKTFPYFPILTLQWFQILSNGKLWEIGCSWKRLLFFSRTLIHRSVKVHFLTYGKLLRERHLVWKILSG